MIALLLLAFSAHAQVTLTAVENYSLAVVRDVWRGTGNDAMPERMVRQVQAPSPTDPYAAAFPRSFFQSDDLLVCFESCRGDTDRVRGAGSGEGAVAVQGDPKDALEQQNIYYWLTKYYDYMRERVDLTPGKRITAVASPRITGSMTGQGPILRNNAEFRPMDASLRFYPAHSHPLTVLFNGRINRSGFDPSVIAHEAGHSLFGAIYPTYFNTEIGGLNEGFADYFANVFLGDPRVGLVMLRGEALRDSATVRTRDGNMKLYQPMMPVHDMGERVSTALWRSREILTDKRAFDRMVVEAVKDIAADPFSTVHGFKRALLARVSTGPDASELRRVTAIFGMHLAGEERDVVDTAFLSTAPSAQPLLQLNTVSRRPNPLIRGASPVESRDSLTVHARVVTASGLLAQLAHGGNAANPRYWVLSDPERLTLRGAWNAQAQPINLAGQLGPSVGATIQAISLLPAIVADVRSLLASMVLLSSNQGTLARTHRVERRTPSTMAFNFNGSQLQASVTNLELRRTFRGTLTGTDAVDSVTLTTIPAEAAPALPRGWPVLDGKPVVGFRVVYADGNQREGSFVHWR